MSERVTNNRGVALLAVLALMGMLSLVAIMAVDRANTDIDLTFNQLHQESAFYVAEAGLNRAFRQLNDDNEWRTGYSNESFGNGAYWVLIIDSNSQAGLDDTLIVRATATVHGSTSNLEAIVVPNYTNPFSYALFGDSAVSVINQTCTNSYNSDSGSYIETSTDTSGDVGSNGTIFVDNVATIGGDVVSALDTGITISWTSSVSGDTISGADPREVEIVPQEEFDWAETVNNAPSGFSGANFDYDPDTHELQVSQWGSLTLSSGVYYFSDIYLENAASIDLVEGASVVIYMTGDINLENITSMNNGGSPADLVIYSQGDGFTLSNDTKFYGSFYGPDAIFYVENNTDLYGSVVADAIVIENQACFHYDRDLRDFSRRSYDGSMSMPGWKEL